MMTYLQAREYLDTEANTLGSLFAEYRWQQQRGYSTAHNTDFRQWVINTALETIYCETFDC